MLHLHSTPPLIFRNLHSLTHIRCCPLKVNLLAALVSSSFVFFTCAQAENLIITPEAENATAVDAKIYVDGVDGPTVGHFYYLNKVNELGSKELTLTIGGAGLIAGANYSDNLNFNSQNRVYAAATFRSITGSSNIVKPLLGTPSTRQENGVFKLDGEPYYLTSSSIYKYVIN